MRTLKKLIPGQPGTKKLTKEYGDKLFCVRYRYDQKEQRKIKTVEIILEESKWKPNSQKIPGNKLVQLRIGYRETYLRKVVKGAGGRWDGERKLWKIPYKEVIQLSLEDRIIDGV
ncbi:MAG: hypothetical protein ACMUJM_18815 [bacterium]